MPYLTRRVTAAALDVSLLVLGVLASWPFRVRRTGGWTANGSTRPSSEGLLLVPYWGLPR